MRRVSNIAFNREFPAVTGVSQYVVGAQLSLRRDWHNLFDSEAVGIWLEGYPSIPFGFLYRKDKNRSVVLAALSRREAVPGHLEFADDLAIGQKRIVFWL